MTPKPVTPPAEAPAEGTRTDAFLRDVVYAPIGGEGLVQQAVRRLAEGIGLGLLKKGERLPPEAQLSEWLGISAMTLREALAILREAGLIETRRGRGGGTFVKRAPSMPSAKEVRSQLTKLTPAYLQDLTDYRKAITGEAAALAAERATDDSIARLEDIAREMVGEKKLDRYRQADAEFHITTATATGSARLAKAETELQIEFNNVIFAVASPLITYVPSMADDSNREHAAIVEALKARDPDLARTRVHEHLASSVTMLRGFGTPQIASVDAPS